MTDFEKQIAEVINVYSKENESDTPDFILAQYLNACLKAFNEGVNARKKWYGGESNDFARIARIQRKIN